jgi:muramidase (phage lysozyme)
VKFEWFLCHCMHQLQGYMSLSSKGNGGMSTNSGLFDILNVWWSAYHLALPIGHMPYVFTYSYIVLM